MGDNLNEQEIDNAINMVNRNSIYVKLAGFIMDKFPLFTREEAMKHIKYLIEEKNYKPKDILDGLADTYLERKSIMKEIEMSCVSKSTEDKIEVPLKTTKQKVSKEEIKRLLKLIGGLTVTVGLLISAYKIAKEINTRDFNKEVDADIATLASETDSVFTENKGYIIEQNSFEVGRNTLNGEKIIAYDNHGIANDIINICIKDINLFDVVMYNTYFNMPTERLVNFEEVFAIVKNHFAQDEAFAPLNERLSTCKNALTYIYKFVKAQGGYSKDEDIYYKVGYDIEVYSNLSNGYNGLTSESQKRIDDLISRYQKLQNQLYRDYGEKIEELATIQRGANNGY